ncbi:succinate-semialdehyde dehydrogenase/glutarate-semialdehyde dehydrogenase [Sphingomonas vulcanisoli]|uniref:Succinate-semialdehyde dehydrogenase/glutarate-semialdehyde dehydrogenase n=1 Tax=Sphingomonas vulcanisoli TaxID=1658060 RepID=A0ABX0TXJ1_9SPHN|nr:NAD-dependent succinate-semialdehyde dehydrogenase [Sphingomonas vulcanisoli]NIJ08485.1 succinate-semialdehyde dehydrogenase/glutarate-semialdehyde dehydrogenase [Sphingomonas vulcanisoli]
MSDVYPKLRLLIDGEWIDAGDRRTHAVIDPATGQTLGELPLASADDLDRALAASDQAFRRWRKTPAPERAAVLTGAARHIRARAEVIARNATREEGKLYAETFAETQMAAALFDFYAGECLRTYGRVLVRPAGQLSRVMYEPVGPVAGFAPWNFPIYNPARKLGPAVGAGCSIILKPAEESPASALAIAEALIDAGLPPGVLQIVFGVPDEVSTRLLASPIIRKLSFTGSTAVGKHLLRLAADTVKRTTMELGGHAPVIIFDDADLDRAVEMLVAAKLRNAGQVCVSPTRFFVQDGVHDRFVAALGERMARFTLGSGLDPTVGMGPTTNPRRPAAVETLVADARAAGARLVTGGERIDGDGFFFQPTLLADVPLGARIMTEEPFGPVALTRRFATLDEVVEQANALPYGLAAYAFTENARRANLIAAALEVGMVGINTAAMAAADAPFGGVKESGNGSEDGIEGFQAFLVTKAIHQL